MLIDIVVPIVIIVTLAMLVLWLRTIFSAGAHTVSREQQKGGSTFSDEPPELDAQYADIKARFYKDPYDPETRREVEAFAFRLRSRCIDLATIKADYSPEYKKRCAQGAGLVRLLGADADEILRKEFG